jgi:D-cysteine desulfhydrase family pyridoxal phosphate-dependent enzyme
MASAPERFPLILLPTPLHRLPRLSEDLGLDLWIKRDDLTGLALGGNKGRKLEYLMAEVRSSGANAVVTCGAVQSNFVRQLAAACSICGVQCHAVVMHLPYDEAVGKPAGEPLGPKGANALLSEMFGANLHLVADGDWLSLYAQAESLAQTLELGGFKVYRVPVGGSSPLGGYAFYQAAKELDAVEPFDAIITPSSSGSTQAGLTAAFKGKKTKVIGISADPEPDIIDDVLRVGTGLSHLLGTAPLLPKDYEIHTDWAGAGYGVRSVQGQTALELMAKREGILLDPIYTGKAFAGLLDLAKDKAIKGRVLFWHTGGVPAVFAHS